MHKTGSSSIQNNFYAQKDSLGNAHYLDVGSANHSVYMYTVFSHKRYMHPLHVLNGRSKDEVDVLKHQWSEKLHSEILSDQNTMIISGEGISFFDEEDIDSLKNFLDKYFSKITIFAYVRDFSDYICSAFQEGVKGDTNIFNLDVYTPRYIERFKKFDEIFGQDSVKLNPFIPEGFYKKDVTLDFASKIGVELDEESISRSNESLSLEATAILYVYRKFGPGYGYSAAATHENAKLVALLSSIGSTKFQFADRLIEPLKQKYKEQIEWIEKRMQPLKRSADKKDKTDVIYIDSEEHLLSYAKNAVGEIEKACKKRGIEISGEDTTYDGLASMMDTVRKKL